MANEFEDCNLQVMQARLEAQGGLEKSTGEDTARHVERHNPVRHIDDLADPQVAGRATQDVGLAAGEAVSLDQPVDHVANRVLGVLHQVGAVGRRGVVALAVGLAQRWTRRLGRSAVGRDPVLPPLQ